MSITNMREKGNPFGETPKERNAYKRGRLAGEKHSNPSPLTMATFKTMTEKIEQIDSKLDSHILEQTQQFSDIKNKQDITASALLELKTSLKEFIEKADDKYSSKWVERFAIWLALAIGGVAVPALLYLGYEVILHIKK